MRGNDFLNKMGNVDPAYVEAAERSSKKKPWGKWGTMAACLAFLVIIGSTAFVVAAEAKEYKNAIVYFEENGLSTEGLNRSEVKAVYRDTIENREKRYVRFSGSFTATVEQLISDYCALPGKPIAVVHFFQAKPFLLCFQEDMTDKLVEGKTYVFTFETFEVEIPDGEEYPSISDYMYSILVTDYRFAEENETGLASKMAEVEIVTK